MTNHPVIRKRIAELQLELGAQAERDGQRLKSEEVLGLT
jgi:hypothetical protein